MNVYQKISELLFVIYPEFVVQKDTSGNEFVLLKSAASETHTLLSEISDKTQYEAVLNHVHLFDHYVGKKNYASVREIGITIAKNLFVALQTAFPSKQFVVFLTLNLQDTIVRFHQIWENEKEYYDETEESDSELVVFR